MRSIETLTTKTGPDDAGLNICLLYTSDAATILLV